MGRARSEVRRDDGDDGVHGFHHGGTELKCSGDARRLPRCGLLARRPEAGVGVESEGRNRKRRSPSREALAIPALRLNPTALRAVQAVAMNSSLLFARLQDSVTASVRLRELRASVVKTVNSVSSGLEYVSQKSVTMATFRQRVTWEGAVCQRYHGVSSSGLRAAISLSPVWWRPA